MAYTKPLSIVKVRICTESLGQRRILKAHFFALQVVVRCLLQVGATSQLVGESESVDKQFRKDQDSRKRFVVRMPTSPNRRKCLMQK